METKLIEINKKDFEAYEAVRQSGMTNMLMISTVTEMSGLRKEKIIAIIKNYVALQKKWFDATKTIKV